MSDSPLPKTFLASVDDLISAGGVIQSSPQNLTVWNSVVVLRLIGGSVPHDELIGSGYKVLSSRLFWGIEAEVSGAWSPLLPFSNNLTVLGTNSSGTFVVRTMAVSSLVYSGLFTIIYRATTAGPWKWDLKFTAGTVGHYRLVYVWQNTTDILDLSNLSKQVRVGFGSANYTFSWGDIPNSFVTRTLAYTGLFSLSIDLGYLAEASSVVVDPTLLHDNVGSGGTPYSFQRHLFYEPSGGNYWVFYTNGFQVLYRYSADATHWSAPYSIVGLPWWGGTEYSSPAVANIGQTVVVAVGVRGTGADTFVWTINGNISGNLITWSSAVGTNFYNDSCYNGTSPCTVDTSTAFVNIAFSADGNLALSFNRLAMKDDRSCASGYKLTNSTLFAWYKNRIMKLDDTGGCNQVNLAQPYPWDYHRSILVPIDYGGMRIVYDRMNETRIYYADAYANGNYDGYPIATGVDRGDFAAIEDSNHVTHIVYRATSGTIDEQRIVWNGLGWRFEFEHDILHGAGLVSSLSITQDSSTGDLYLLGVAGSSIVEKRKPPTQTWTEQTAFFPVKDRVGPKYLGTSSTIASLSQTYLVMIWTEGSDPGPYNAVSASVPVQNVWSPFSYPSDPWDGGGLAPFGQYFTNLDEHVSASSGMLVVRQTDLSIRGRGLDLDIARVYVEPYSFIDNTPLNYERYPWAPMGNGWQLNFPWMNNVTAPSNPSYIHLWNGQAYRIPSSFWSSTEAKLENHRGQHFQLVRNSTAIFLYAPSGTYYRFNLAYHRLDRISDGTGQNRISFQYDESHNRIQNITDTIDRVFQFCYSGNLLRSINQTTGNCSSGAGSLRGIVFSYSQNPPEYGATLASVTDAGGRITRFAYLGYSWLLYNITYSTGAFTNYAYQSFQLGTQAFTVRVLNQTVYSASNAQLRRVHYSYKVDVGDQVTGSAVQTYQAAFSGWQSRNQYDYSFSSAGVAWNVSETGPFRFVRGVRQTFGVHGEVTKETILVSDNAMSNPRIGKYDNHYSYDLWGNPIYGSRAVNATANAFHEVFNAYHNSGVPIGFHMLEDMFRMDDGHYSENLWQAQKGFWSVANGVLNGTWNGGADEETLASADIGKADGFTLQTRLKVGRDAHTGGVATPRFGIFVHYPGSGTNKWALVTRYSPASSTSWYLELLDEGGTGWLGNSQPSARIVCNSPTYGSWWTFNLTITYGYMSGWAQLDGGSKCSVSGSFSSTSPSFSATGIGLYPGGFSVAFDNITLAIPIGMGYFTNSFISNGAPGPNVHNALAGSAEIQSASSGIRMESYYSYDLSGPVKLEKRRFDGSTGTRWISTSWSYDPSNGNLISITDPRGNSTSYAYSPQYNYAYLTSQTHSLRPGTTTVTAQYTYNSTTGNLVSATDAMGNTTSFENDRLGRKTRTSYPLGAYVQYNYFDQNNYVDVVNQFGWKTRQAYDGLGRLARVERFSGSDSYSNETYTYNWQGRPANRTDPLGRISRYEYDVLGRITKSVQADGNSTQVFYNDYASWIRTTDESGVNKCQVYDRLGRLLSLIEKSSIDCVSGIVTNYYYDEVGELVTVLDANLKYTRFNYDNLNRLTQKWYPDLSSEAYTYDDNGNLVNRRARDFTITLYAYDSLNRLTTITYCWTTVTSDNYSYDKNSNLLRLESLNATLTYAYDSRNRVLKETYNVNQGTTGSDLTCPTGSGGGGGSVAYGTLITMADRTTKPVQDLRVGDRILGYDTGAGQFTRAAVLELKIVDTSNMLILSTSTGTPIRVDANPAQTLWVKKMDGSIGWASVTDIQVGDYLFSQDETWVRVTSIEFAPRGRHVMFDIIATAPYFASGFLDPQVKGNPGGRPSSTSTRGSISLNSPPAGTPSTYTIAYSYSGETLASITYPDLRYVDYTYDGLGRLQKITGNSNLYATFSYTQTRQLKGIGFGNGFVGNYTYDANGQPSQIKLSNPATSSTLLLLNYAYNRTGTILQISGSSTDGTNTLAVNERYNYDSIKRLTNATVQTGSTITNQWYEYDNLGNRKRQNQNGQITSYSYNLDYNRLTSYSGTGTGASFTYSSSGSLTQRSITSGGTTSSWSYSYSAAEGLVKAASGVVQGLYAYDGMGRRVESVEGGTASFYAYLGTETLAEKTGTSWTDYIYAGRLRIAKIVNGPTRYYHTDHLGSTRLVTSMGASVLFSNGYQPFGQDNGTPMGSEGNKFTGKQSSTSNGFYYHFQRWYDTSTGRFISEDPVAGDKSNPRSMNPYVYVLNTPTVLQDPAGLSVGINRPCVDGPVYCGPIAEPDLGAAMAVLMFSMDLHRLGAPSFFRPGGGYGEPLSSDYSARVRTPDSGEPTATAKKVNVRTVIGIPTKGRVAVIGEDMPGRVKPFASKYDYETMQDLSRTLSTEQKLTLNRAWINARMDEGYTIVDLGPARTYANYPYITSNYYAMEQAELAARNYARWIPMWGVID